MRAALPPSDAPLLCKRFAEAAVLRVDRELGPAEAAALEAHLLECPACRRRAREAEAVVSALRHWERTRAALAPPPRRIGAAVGAAVAELGRWRRAEARLARRLAFVTRAAVLLSLAGGLLAGLLLRPAGPAGVPLAASARPSPGAAADVAAGAPPRSAPPTRTARAPLRLPPAAPSRLAASPPLSVAPSTLPTREEREQAVAYLSGWQARAEERHAVELSVGEPAYWWRAERGEERLITWGALRSLRGRGARDVETFVRTLKDERTLPARDTREPAGEGPVRIDLTVADALALPRGHGDLAALLALPVLRFRTNPETRHATTFYVLPREAKPPALPAVEDLAGAVAKGSVVLGEGVEDDVVALVRGTKQPVFVPAGEVISGGRVDRVVARDLWLPASERELRIVLPCVAVSTPLGGSGKQLVPTGVVAGPGLRRLLAQGASASAVRGWLAERIPARRDGEARWSLLPFLRSAGREVAVEAAWRALRGARGFVAVDGGGNVIGVETTDLPAGSAATLLVRLVLGYAQEGEMLALANESPRPVRPAGTARRTLEALASSPAAFFASGRAEDGADARLARADDPASLFVVETLDRAGEGRVLTSALAP